MLDQIGMAVIPMFQSDCVSIPQLAEDSLTQKLNTMIHMHHI